MLRKLFNQASRTRQRRRLSIALDPYLPTNEDRILAWRQRLKRYNRALRNGRSASFPLPVTKG